jgi:hypothetical protein
MRAVIQALRPSVGGETEPAKDGDELVERRPLVPEGLREERDASFFDEPTLVRREATGEEDDPVMKLGPGLERTPVEVDTVELRHPAVGEHDVEALTLRNALEGGHRRSADLDVLKPGAAQQARVRLRHGDVIVEQ